MPMTNNSKWNGGVLTNGNVRTASQDGHAIITADNAISSVGLLNTVSRPAAAGHDNDS
jgi:hypothetical protein